MVIRIYQKLVRDKIPQIIKSDGQTPNWRTITNKEAHLRMLVNEKLPEEVDEAIKAKGELILTEFADVLQVMRDILELKGISPERLEEVCRERFEKRGGFTGGIFLESIDVPDK